MLEREFHLTPRERTELRERMRSRTLPAEDVRRARLILLLAQGKSYLTIRQQLGCNPNYISRWKERLPQPFASLATRPQLHSPDILVLNHSVPLHPGRLTTFRDE